jgi:microcystin-dependent protein
MANYEATRYDWDGAYLTGVQGVNTGLIIPWGSTVVPSGFLECNGQAVSQATYSALYAIIGVTYGNPGGGNFNVPDLTDRTALSKSNTKSITTSGGANTVANSGSVCGSLANYTLTTAELPSHTHNYNPANGSDLARFMATSRGDVGGNSGSTGGGGAHGHTLASATFTGSSNSVLQPYLTLMYIIKT